MPLALVGLAVLWGLWRESRAQIDLAVEGQAQLAAVAFERWVEEQRVPLRAVAAQFAARREVVAPASQSPKPESLAVVLTALVRNRPHWLGLHVLDRSGSPVLSEPAHSDPPPPGTVKDVFAELERRRSWSVITDWTRSDGRSVVVIGAPLEGGGAVVVRADGAAVGELFRDIRLSPGSVIAVFDARRRVLYRSPTPQSYVVADATNEEFFAPLDARRTAVVESESPYDGVRRIYGFARAGDTDSVVLVGTPTSVLLEPARRQLTRYALFSLLALACAAITATLVARGVVGPMQALERATRTLGAGNFDARAPAEGDDEFARLGASFNAMAEQIAEREARLTQFDRLKSEFVSSVSHELRTPLTTIKTLTRLLQRGRTTEEERREYLDAIAQECDRQIDLVVNLLDLSRIEAGAFSLTLLPVDVGEVMRSSLAALTPTAARGQELRLILEGDLPRAEADPGALRRVLTGLVENAIKYSPEGARITLYAGRSGSEPNTLAVSVSDTGPGIPAENLPHLFEKFYRGHPSSPAADEAAPGVGLGLYLARALVERMNGSLSVESRIGEGSTFTVLLRSCEVEGEVPAPADATESERTDEPQKV